MATDKAGSALRRSHNVCNVMENLFNCGLFLKRPASIDHKDGKMCAHDISLHIRRYPTLDEMLSNFGLTVSNCRAKALENFHFHPF
jgi:hypothetical protein